MCNEDALEAAVSALTTSRKPAELELGSRDAVASLLDGTETLSWAQDRVPVPADVAAMLMSVINIAPHDSPGYNIQQEVRDALIAIVNDHLPMASGVGELTIQLVERHAHSSVALELLTAAHAFWRKESERMAERYVEGSPALKEAMSGVVLHLLHLSPRMTKALRGGNARGDDSWPTPSSSSELSPLLLK